ncbi:hypothetical protein ACIQCR_17255 [Streptomyces sp. NPDC093249]|uniref:hypothetical protein n=1 Tax=unclassified Streptomyces TaxID=2593676 RepID=UPI003814A0E0
MPTPTADSILMLLPFGVWISVPEATAATGLTAGTVRRLARTGRRRGVLCTRGEGAAQQIKRVHAGPRRRTPSQPH